MTALLRWEAFTGFSSGNLADNTAMASRANGYKAVAQVGGTDVVIDNETDKYPFMEVTVGLGSWTPAVTDSMELYLLYAADGTNYESGGSFLPPPDMLAKTIRLSTDTSAAAKLFTRLIPIRPLKFKVLWRWLGTNSTASSGNTMSQRRGGYNLNG